jgi:hypothetical protein
MVEKIQNGRLAAVFDVFFAYFTENPKAFLVIDGCCQN